MRVNLQLFLKRALDKRLLIANEASPRWLFIITRSTCVSEIIVLLKTVRNVATFLVSIWYN